MTRPRGPRKPSTATRAATAEPVAALLFTDVTEEQAPATAPPVPVEVNPFDTVIEQAPPEVNAFDLLDEPPTVPDPFVPPEAFEFPEADSDALPPPDLWPPAPVDAFAPEPGPSEESPPEGPQEVTQHTTVFLPPVLQQREKAPAGASWFMPIERYYGAFVNPLPTIAELGQQFNFEEARRKQARRLRQDSREVHFHALEKVSDDYTHDENRSVQPAKGPWEEYVLGLLDLRKQLNSDVDGLITAAPNQDVFDALLWAGETPIDRLNDAARLRAAAKSKDGKKTGMWAALVDLTIRRHPMALGPLGLALNVLSYRLFGVTPEPEEPEQTFIFDQGVNAGTTFNYIPRFEEGVAVSRRVASIAGRYEVSSVEYHSALGWKKERTSGTTIGWRQISLRPLGDVLPIEGQRQVLEPDWLDDSCASAC